MEDKSLFMFFVAGTIGIVVMALAFLYMVHIFRNRKNSEYIDRQLNRRDDLAAQVEEYERLLHQLSRDIHDLFGQNASLIGMKLGMMEEKVEQGKSVSLDDIGKVVKLVRQMVLDATNLGHSLNTEYIASSRLCELLGDELEYIGERNGLSVEMDCKADPVLKADQRVLLYRIVREALRNITKHALATFVRVIVAEEDGSLRIVISDNGIGFSKDRIYTNPVTGILNMRQRAAMLKGEIDIKSQFKEGSSVTFSMGTYGKS